ncbi:MAG: 50S ribosomal protein L4 [Actinomycetota bacterium]|nr:50S ribosomal protein L4 [Actinomycetota bacterium]
MMEVPVLDAMGRKVGQVKLEPRIFESEVNEAAVHQVVRAQLAASRLGTSSTKTRSEVRGGGAKPWRQKGTGRARAGSIRSPLWRGGGVVFGPTPRDYSFTVPKKVKRLALRSALSMKAKSSELLVVDDFNIKEPKTKLALEVLRNLKVSKKATVVIVEGQENVEKSLRNIPGIKTIYVSEVNPYDVLDNEVLIFTRDALGALTEVVKE